MRSLFSLLTSMCLAVCLLGRATPHAAAAEPDPARPTPTQRWILDDQGRVLVMHGINMVYKVGSYAPDQAGFGRDDARFLRRQGFTTVRLGLIWRAAEPQPGQYNNRYIDRIERTARILAAEGIWVMLDFHQDLYHERFQGEGAPTWAVLDDGLANQPQLGFPNNYFAMPGLNRAFDNFWNNAAGPGGVGLQQRFAASVAHVVKRFKDAPQIMGVDIFNEPWPGTGWQTCANTVGCPEFDAKLERFSQRVIDAVRRVDTRTPVFYEPHVLFNNGVPTYVTPRGKNLGFSFHDYCLTADVGAGETTGDDPACGTFDGMVWDNVRAHVADTGHPAILSEFGATTVQATLKGMVLRAQRNLIGWQYWAYCGCDDPTTTGPGNTQAIVFDPAKPPKGNNVDWAKMRALVVPHPLAISGTPKFSRISKTQVFRVRWSVQRAQGAGRFQAGAKSVLSVPRLKYPQGYRVRLGGARVVSEPNARRLVVVQRPGADDVWVEVTPRRG